MRNMVLIAILVSPAIPLIAQDGALDVKAFNDLGQDSRQTMILAGLETREAALQNFSYSLSAATDNRSLRDGSLRPLRRESYTIKRTGGLLFLSGLRQGPAGNTTAEFASNWNGKAGRSFTRFPNTTDSGLIHDKGEDANFRYLRYNKMLGFRMVPNDGRKVTLAEWFRDAIAVRQPIETTAVQTDGKTLVIAKVNENGAIHTYTFDPSRGMMPVHYDYRDGTGKYYNRESLTVADAKQVEGLWVPVRVVLVSGTSTDEEETVNTFEVKEFTRRNVTEKECEVVFPPGTVVVDLVGRICYKILPSGAKEMRPWLDPATGKILDPGITSVAEVAIAKYPSTSPAAQTATSAPVKPAVVVEMPTKTPKADRTIWPWVVVASGAVLILAGITVFCAKRRTKRAF